MLNELDKELVSRGLRYVRYADDCVIAVGSSASANRVMHSITEWVVRRTCVAKYISKEVLSRKGLVSCLDYYLIRHSLKTN